MKPLYTLLQIVWGFPQTAVGAVLFLLNIGRPHYFYHGAVVTAWKSKSSLSLGMFIFVTDDVFFYYDSCREKYDEATFTKMLLTHEYGHTVQSLIFGPLYLLFVGVPSTVWSFLPAFAKKRMKGEISYFSVYPENWANRLGEAATKERSIGELI